MNIPLLEWIILVIVALLFAIQLFYYLYFYSAILFVKKSEPVLDKSVPVSVVMCAKNEAENLKQNLPIILEQKYPEFQVVVINDCSDDDSEDVLKVFKAKYPNLHYSTIKEDPIFKHGKKLAVLLGIKAAKYDHLLFTDADCKPLSENWIQSMARNFKDKKTIVLGTYNLKKEKGFLNHVQQYENLLSKILYLGFALRNRPFMGVGGNLAYVRTLFFENKGFAGHYHVPSGDDDLFVNKVSNKENTTIEYSPDSQVLTEGKTQWRHYFKQKRRHLGASTMYKKRDKSWLFFDTLTMGLFYVFAVLAILFNIFPIVMASLLFVRIVLGMVVINLCAKKLNQQKFYATFLFLDLLLPSIYLILAIKNKFRPASIRWK